MDDQPTLPAPLRTPATPSALFAPADAAPDKPDPARTPLEDRPGTIGPYRILERIGTGGMGEVYRAEQREPIRREVAIKLVKLGMDTHGVIARFEAERQALAVMDHPNIARVFDAGADARGRPYFVMELVRGEPITQYADRHQLSLRDRLQILQQVCHAVQHAHAKGIIHRDIKPGNILVGTQDGRPVAKIIDFGIAKATSQRLTDKTVFTEFVRMIGTPQYMSPEQAEGNFDIDTRSDIYSLGVVLYELLVGQVPFDTQRLRSAALHEMVRMIREVEPQRPSTRFAARKDTQATVAALRGVEPARLTHLLRGELDWVVMKCLEKDRDRRYATADALAEDLDCFLQQRPVTARPPSRAYALHKLIRRHRAAFAGVTIICLCILISLAVSLWLYSKERTARSAAELARYQAEQARQQVEVAREQEQAQRTLAVEHLRLARAAVDQIARTAEQRLPGQPTPYDLTRVRQEMLAAAAEFYEALYRSQSGDRNATIQLAQAQTSAASLRFQLGQSTESLELARKAEALLEPLQQADPRDAEVARMLAVLASHRYFVHFFHLADYRTAEPLARHMLEKASHFYALAPEVHDVGGMLAHARLCLGRCLQRTGRPEEAIEQLLAGQQLMSIVGERLDPDWRSQVETDFALRTAEAYQSIGLFDRALQHYDQAEKIISRRNDERAVYTRCLVGWYRGVIYWQLGQFTQGEQHYRELIATLEPMVRNASTLGPKRDLGSSYEMLAECLQAQGRLDQARQTWQTARQIRQDLYNAEPTAWHALFLTNIAVFCPDESMRDPAGALQIIEPHLHRNPEHQRLIIHRGGALFLLTRFAEARQSFEQAAALGGDGLGFAGHLYAMTLWQLGEHEAARVALRQADAYAARFPPAYFRPGLWIEPARNMILSPATQTATRPAR